MSNPYSTRGHEFKSTSNRTIGACIDVQKQLGVHCMEVDYQREVHIPIAYDGVVVTKRRVDFVIWDAADESDELLLETKARSVILPEDIEQCLLYLHQGGYQICLLINFGEKPLGIKRLVHTPPSRQPIK